MKAITLQKKVRDKALAEKLRALGIDPEQPL
jgi:hypothetical protein